MANGTEADRRNVAAGIGTRLRGWREARGETLRGVAARVGISASTLSRWESGKHLPNVPELEAVLNALGATEAQQREILGLINTPRTLHRLREREEVGIPVGGDLLRAMRLRRGWTQAEAARAAGTTQGQIAKWETSEAWPDAARLQSLCWALGARHEEVTALTAGNFRWEAGSSAAISPRCEDQGDWEAAVNGALYNAPHALLDLTFLSLEAQLWRMREQQAFALPLLSVAYAHHARAHLFHLSPAQRGSGRTALWNWSASRQPPWRGWKRRDGARELSPPEPLPPPEVGRRI